MPNCLTPYNFCAIRITKLDPDGETNWGADAYFVVSPISLQAEPTIDESPSLLTRDGCGRVCANPTTPSTVTGYTLTGTLCKNDFELKAALFGGTVVYTAGNAVGWAAPSPDTVPDPVCIEGWQYTADGDNIGTINGVQQYMRHIFPYVTCVPASETYENAVTNPGFVGTSTVNNQIGAGGPFDDWLQPVNGPIGEQYDATLPAIFCNGQSLAS